MTALTLWLLINTTEGRYPTTLEQFITEKECVRVAKLLYNYANDRGGIEPPRLVCVQATVAR